MSMAASARNSNSSDGRMARPLDNSNQGKIP
jgi:hypothetical protein